MRARANNLLLTGVPGCGKTTVIEKVVCTLGRACVRGFLTREIRERGARRGFSIETFDGASAILSHVDSKRGPRIGRYRVDVEALDEMVDGSLADDGTDAIMIIDEIGKMECLSGKFREAVLALLASPRIVVATIALRASGFIARVKSMDSIALWEVTGPSRDEMPARITDWIDSVR